MGDTFGDAFPNEDIEDIKQYLSDAGCNYDSMSRKEMSEMYKVLKDSQNTASQDEQRRLQSADIDSDDYNDLRINSVPVFTNGNSSKDKDELTKCTDISTTSEDWTSQEIVTSFLPKRSSRSSIKEEEEEISSTVTVTKSDEDDIINEDDGDIDVFNCVPTAHEPLARRYCNPKYDPPIYCNPNIAHKSYEERTKLLFRYHLLLAQKYNNYQRTSQHQAPWGKPIQTNYRFNGNLKRKIDNNHANDDENKVYDFNDEVDVYVSLSGRQTKRKLYTEESDNSNEGWIRKSKVTKVSSENITNKSEPRKRQVLSKTGNDEIVKRSKLFADKPKTRSEDMFDSLCNQSREKKEAEIKKEKYIESLKNGSSDEEEPTSTPSNLVNLIHDDDDFMRRRIPPPSGLKKNNVANKPAGRGKNKKNTNKSGPKEKNKKYDSFLNMASSTTTRSTKLLKDRCPVCNEEFFQNELPDHTPSCLDLHTETDDVQKEDNFVQNVITCKVCDEVFELNFEYQEHVHHCIANHK